MREIKLNLLRTEEEITRQSNNKFSSLIPNFDNLKTYHPFFENTAVIYYFEDHNRLQVLISWFENKQQKFLKKSLNASLAKTQGVWRRLFRQFQHSQKTPSRWSRNLTLLSHHLVTPWIEQIPSHISNLLISPTKDLYGIPFSCLKVESDNRYLIEHFTLKIVPSLQTYIHCTDIQPSTKTSFAIGSSYEESSLRTLSNVRSELDVISDSSPNSQVYFDTQFGREYLFSIIDQPQFFHFAGHIQYDKLDPLQTRLILDENTAITASDFYLQPNILNGTTAILSGCGSGLLEPLGGEVLGLNSSLLFAGCRGVVSTLWPINDSATAGLMGHLYQRISDQNQDGFPNFPEALRYGQLQLLKDQNYSAPYYWSGFYYMGGSIRN